MLPPDTTSTAEVYAFLIFDSPIGRLRLVTTPDALIEIKLHAPQEPPAPVAARATSDGPAADLCHQVQQQVEAYLAGQQKHFTVPLDPRGTPFQKKVWQEMVKIPYGQTLSYGEMARKINNPGATQALGNACGANPIPLIIPCHRVLASRGLGGFSGGLDTKRQLLTLEGVLQPELPLFGPD